MPASERDRDSVGLTAQSQADLATLAELGWWPELQDIAKFAMAYAIHVGIPAGETAGTDTRWAAGNFDKSGEIRVLLAAVYPDCTTPVRLMEHLVNEGLRLISHRVRTGKLSPSDLLS